MHCKMLILFCICSQGNAETNQEEEAANSKIDLSFIEKVINISSNLKLNFGLIKWINFVNCTVYL